ncbi:MAG: hypothetical protein P4L51_24900, partial [Puia sp.]|nr:hypothetical protein [Puia sp.]
GVGARKRGFGEGSLFLLTSKRVVVISENSLPVGDERSKKEVRSLRAARVSDTVPGKTANLKVVLSSELPW